MSFDMALIFLGKTQCSVCGTTFIDGDEIIGIPPISDIAHPLYEYFDTGVHKSCYDKWDKKDEIQAVVDKEKSN
jgi:hypothetical protein